MKMHLINGLLEAYVEYLKTADLYKWQAVRQFQSEWNGADLDFAAMFERSVSADFEGKWWKDRPVYFRRAMKEMIRKDPERVRQMFHDLLYPRVAFKSRFEFFLADCNDIFKELRKEVGFDVKRHWHDEVEVVISYLSWHAPDKMPLYRYAPYKAFLTYVEARNVPLPDFYEDYVKTHEIILKIILRNEDLVEVLKEKAAWEESWLLISQDFIEWSGKRILG
jgi:hypothetical protein